MSTKILFDNFKRKIFYSVFLLYFTGCFLFLSSFSLNAQLQKNTLSDSLYFGGDHIVYDGQRINLGPKAFFIDGELTNKEVADDPFVFNTFNSAVSELSDGSEDEPMTLYIAPWVYWIDDPDDPQVRVPKEGDNVPFGMEIDCEWLTFFGLSEDPKDVILASNRGQTMGAKGNFTMLNISGDGTRAENITFGNYCNIDLVYPLKPELGRKKRGSAIVQAQLVFCDGDKLVARNTHFISRLNLCPFTGGKRVLFDRCHFESTDDALNPTAVYLNCTFDFHSGKPFWGTDGTGVAFLDCDIHSLTDGSQYFTKAGGQLALVDTRIQSNSLSYLGWKDQPAFEARNYQYNVFLNGCSMQVDSANSFATVDMQDKKLLKSYRFCLDDDVIYNTYNLLCGDDGWDPMNVKDAVKRKEQLTGEAYSGLPVQLKLTPSRDTLETGKDSVVVEADLFRFRDFPMEVGEIEWTLSGENKDIARIVPLEGGKCLVIPDNSKNETLPVAIEAKTSEGLEAASVFYVSPEILSPPEFIARPELNLEDGIYRVSYDLDMPFRDQSLVTWYRCADKNGGSSVKVAVSRFDVPKKEYKIARPDVGYYLMATVQPKHLRCHPGDPVRVISHKPVTEDELEDINSNQMQVDFRSLPADYQPQLKPGFWSVDSYKPADTNEYNWLPDNEKSAWYYGSGLNGAANDTGFVQAVKGARLRYTPLRNITGDMQLSFTAVPAKTAGQGFSSAKAQYMDVFLKFDHYSMTGYALRLIRTTKYSDAIDFILMKYTNGKIIQLSEPVSASCYRTPCYINLEIKGNEFRATAETPAQYPQKPNHENVVDEVDIRVNIEPNSFGGFGFQHTGSVGTGATLLKNLEVSWGNKN